MEVKGLNPVGASEFFLGFLCNCFSCFITVKITFTYNILIFLSLNRDLKIVILGDASVGKTSLIQRYIQGVFTEDQISVSKAALLLS